MKTRSYRDLRVWQEAMRLTTRCYELTRRFPADERFGLTSQIRRSATSVAANIAEGHGRFTRGEYLNFLSIANGSLRELETHVLTARVLGFVTCEDSRKVLGLATSISHKLVGLAGALRAAAATARRSRAHFREGRRPEPFPSRGAAAATISGADGAPVEGRVSRTAPTSASTAPATSGA